jgi:hypothetical protein
MKEARLLNVIPDSLEITSSVSLNNYSSQDITGRLNSQFSRR